MAGKIPAFQFYPADWRKDPGVQALTFHQRGVWFEVLCLMHESPKRGYLLLPNGKTISDDALGRVIGLQKQELASTLQVLLELGVASRDPSTGALINRRMVRDEAKRQQARVDGSTGGSPALTRGYNSPGFVYVVRKRNEDIFKIGIAANPKNRIRKIEYHLKTELDEVAIFAVEDMGKTESDLHKQFESKKEYGEWFRLSESDLLTLKGQFKGQPRVEDKGQQRASSSSSSSSSETSSRVRERKVEEEMSVEDPAAGDQLDRQIRAFISGHKFITYDAKSHAKCRELVLAVGWDQAKQLIDQAVASAASFPIGWALGTAQKREQAKAATPPQKRQYKSVTKRITVGEV